MTPPKKRNCSGDAASSTNNNNNTTAIPSSTVHSLPSSTSIECNKQKSINSKKVKQEKEDNNAATAVLTGTPVDFLYKTMLERDPRKRKVKPVDHKNFESFALFEDSSSDESYKPKGDDDDEDQDLDDEDDNSTAGGDDDDDASSEADDDDDDDDHEESSQHDSQDDCKASFTEVTSPCKSRDHHMRMNSIRICAVCSGDVSVDADEIIECDSCSITVHENCYGVDEAVVEDNESVHSTLSSASTEPWFCDACQAGVRDPVCELCPNSGGIFKKTDSGRWVHLVCALYTNGVAFADTVHLTGITLFELPSDKWGAKACSICEDERFARTGVTISCDAGLCKTYFHVTCGQREGLLQEVQDLEHETEIVDPFVAHCKVHAVQKHVVKSKKRNFLSLQSRMKFKKSLTCQLPSRTQKKLMRSRDKWRRRFGSLTQEGTPIAPPSHAPSKKIPRPLTTCPTAVRVLMKKAELMGFTAAPALVGSLDIRKKWHIPPAFSVEFVSYYVDRASRVNNMKKKLSDLKTQDENLKREEQETTVRLNAVIASYDSLKKTSCDVITKARSLWSKVSHCTWPAKSNNTSVHFPKVFESPAKLVQKTHHSLTTNGGMTSKRHASFSSPAAKRIKGRHVKSLIFQSQQQSQESFKLKECGICHEHKDQHLLALCDRCRLHFHLFCLDPPLSRMPKKSRFGGWQCSDCTDKVRQNQLIDHTFIVNEDEEGDRSVRRRKAPPTKFEPESEKKKKVKRAKGSGIILANGQKKRGRPPLPEKEKQRRALMKEKMKQIKMMIRKNKLLEKKGLPIEPIPEMPSLSGTSIEAVLDDVPSTGVLTGVSSAGISSTGVSSTGVSSTGVSSAGLPSTGGDINSVLHVTPVSSSPLKMVIKREPKPKKVYQKKVKVEEECFVCHSKSFAKDLVRYVFSFMLPSMFLTMFSLPL